VSELKSIVHCVSQYSTIIEDVVLSDNNFGSELLPSCSKL